MFFKVLLQAMQREGKFRLKKTNSTNNTACMTSASSRSMSAKGMNIANFLFEGSHEDHVRIESALRKLPIMTMAPLHHYYQLSILTLYDYELPPGMITMNEVKLLIELYRAGGKLMTKSVHKLLRLGYKLLKDRPNVTNVSIGTHHDRLTVVGDLHGKCSFSLCFCLFLTFSTGQLADLLHILDTKGLPNLHNKYIFNGDFVDRGDFGMEVMCILLALLIAAPDSVFLNRGNHEDYAICSVYGFQQECYEKYDAITFGLVLEVFQQIPLFAVVNDEVFVVHGGLFHAKQVTLEDLQTIDRTTFTLEDLPEEGEALDGFLKEAQPREYASQLVRDALWSDPMDGKGLKASQRGAGVNFGVDITTQFLATNSLKMVVRSHECIRSGYDEPYEANSTASAHPSLAPMLCTIFSASDYGGCGNSAAYLVFQLPAEEDGEAAPEQSSNSPQHENTSERKFLAHSNNGLFYTVHYFYATPLRFLPSGGMGLGGGADQDDFEGNRTTLFVPSNLPTRDHTGLDYNPVYDHLVPHLPVHEGLSGPGGGDGMVVVGSTYFTVEELIGSRKHLIRERCSLLDIAQEGLVTLREWLKVISEVLNISFSWQSLGQYFMKEEFYIMQPPGLVKIRYETFLDSYPNVEDEFALYQQKIEEEKARKQLEVDDFAAGVLARYRSSSGASSMLSEGSGEVSTGSKKLEPKEEEVKDERKVNKTSGSELAMVPLPTVEENKIDLVVEMNVDVAIAEPTEQVQVQTERKYFGYANVTEEMADIVYSPGTSEQLDQTFQFLDQDQDGWISYEDVLQAFQQLQIIRPHHTMAMDSVDKTPETRPSAVTFSEEPSSNGQPASFGARPPPILRPAKPLLYDIDTIIARLKEITSLLDLYECDAIDRNIFYEMYRLSELVGNAIFAEGRPNFAREMSFSQELHRLSHAQSLAPLPTSGVVSPSSAYMTKMPNAINSSTFSSIELKKGYEIGVDTELTANHDTNDASAVGLSLDI